MPTLRDCPAEVLLIIFESLSTDYLWALSLVHRDFTSIAQRCLLRYIDLQSSDPSSHDIEQKDKATRVARVSYSHDVRGPPTESTVGMLLCRTMRDSPNLAGYIRSIVCTMEEHTERLVELFRLSTRVHTIVLDVEHGISEKASPIMALALRQLDSTVRVKCKVEISSTTDLKGLPEHYFDRLSLCEARELQSDPEAFAPNRKNVFAREIAISSIGDVLPRQVCSYINPPAQLFLNLDVSGLSPSFLREIYRWSSPSVEVLYVFRKFWDIDEYDEIETPGKPAVRFVKLRKLITNTLNLTISPIDTVEVLMLVGSSCLVPNNLREWIQAKTSGIRLRRIILDPPVAPSCQPTTLIERDVQTRLSAEPAFSELSQLCNRVGIFMDDEPLWDFFRDLDQRDRKEDIHLPWSLTAKSLTGPTEFPESEFAAMDSYELLGVNMSSIEPLSDDSESGDQ